MVFDRAKSYVVIIVIVLLLGLAYRSLNFYQNLDGHHIFRQAMIACNIHYFLQEGISISTKLMAKNMPQKIFDFPLYQQIVALLCFAFGTNFILTGRALNIVVYFLTSLTLLGLLSSLGTKRSMILLTLFFFAISPLNIIFNRAIMPDNLAVLFSFLSLLLFIHWYRGTANRSLCYFVMVVFGILSTLIKNPIYFAVVVAIIVFYVSNKDYKGLFSPAMLAFLGTILFVVVIFKIYANSVNGPLPYSETKWYFGDMELRLNRFAYTTIFRSFAIEVVSPPVFTLVLLGFAQYFLTSRKEPDKEWPVILGLVVGAGLTILIFFNLNVVHDYYQLPFVFVTCFLAARGADDFFQRINYALKDANPRPRKGWMIFIMIFVLGAIAYLNRPYVMDLVEPEEMKRAGNFIRSHTAENGFVLYTSKKGSWNPAGLYYATREGYNVTAEQLSSKLFEKLYHEFGSTGRVFYLYVPFALQQKVPDSALQKARMVSRSAEDSLFILDYSLQ